MLEAPTCLHAVGQGALAVECRFEMMMMMPGMVTVAVEIMMLMMIMMLWSEDCRFLIYFGISGRKTQMMF